MSWVAQSKKIVVNNAENLAEIIVEGFIQYVNLKYPKIKTFDSAFFTELPIFEID
jgi:hypothetical protein